MFYTVLKDINGSGQSSSKGKSGKGGKGSGRGIQNNKVWKELFQNTQDLVNSGGEHPKFAVVSDLVSIRNVVKHCCMADGLVSFS